MTSIALLIEDLIEVDPFAEESMMSTTTGDTEFIIYRITKTAGVCGGEACIRGTRIAVWMLLESKDRGCTDEQFLDNYPHISREDLEAAWQYALQNEDELRQQIQNNRDA